MCLGFSADWRQKYLIKNTSELQDLGNTAKPLVEHAIPFRRTIIRLVKAVIFLGIPYLFERAAQDAKLMDEEGQTSMNSLQHNDTPLGRLEGIIVSSNTLLLQRY